MFHAAVMQNITFVLVHSVELGPLPPLLHTSAGLLTSFTHYRQ